MKSMVAISLHRIGFLSFLWGLTAIPLSVSFAQESSTVIITPVNGVANTFELIRVYPDKVEVRREGIRLNFSRDSIKRVKNPSADQILQEARTSLDQVEEENLETFPDLLAQMERHLPRVQSITQKFDWMIPEATDTFQEVQQSMWDLRDTLAASQSLDSIAAELEKMVRGITPLAPDWEQKIATAMAEAERIPYVNIRTSVVDRLARIRRTIRLDLAEKVGGNLNRIRHLGQELLDLREKGELNEQRWTLSLGEMDRLAGMIPDPRAREEIVAFIQDIRHKTEIEIEQQRQEHRLREAEEGLKALQAALASGQIQPASLDIDPAYLKTSQAISSLTEGAEKDRLTADFEGLRESVKIQSASGPLSASHQILSQTSPAGQALPATGGARKPAGLLDQLMQSLYAQIAAALVAGLVLLLLLGWWVGRRRKAAKAGSPKVLADMSDYDIFTTVEESAEPSGRSAIAAAMSQSPAQPEEDIFGFADPVDTSKPEPLVEEEEDAFAFDEPSGRDLEPKEDLFKQASQFGDPIPVKPTEEDLFGFGSAAEEEEDEDEAAPPAPAKRAEEDLFSFDDEEEPVAATPASGLPEPPDPDAINLSQDDVFTFRNDQIHQDSWKADAPIESEDFSSLWEPEPLEPMPEDDQENEDSSQPRGEPGPEDGIYYGSESDSDSNLAEDPFGFGPLSSSDKEGEEEDSDALSFELPEEEDDLFEEDEDDDDPFGLKK